MRDRRVAQEQAARKERNRCHTTTPHDSERSLARSASRGGARCEFRRKVSESQFSRARSLESVLALVLKIHTPIFSLKIHRVIRYYTYVNKHVLPTNAKTLFRNLDLKALSKFMKQDQDSREIFDC